MGQKFTLLRYMEPCLNMFGQLDALMLGLISDWKQQDLEPFQVKSILVSALHNTTQVIIAASTMAHLLWYI